MLFTAAILQPDTKHQFLRSALCSVQRTRGVCGYGPGHWQYGSHKVCMNKAICTHTIDIRVGGLETRSHERIALWALLDTVINTS